MMPASETTRPWSAPPTVDDVERVRGMTDPVVRNLLITDTYHRLATALALHTGPVCELVRLCDVGVAPGRADDSG